MTRKPIQLLEAVTQRLRSSSLRVTRKRERILGALLSLDRPASAAEVAERAGLPETDLVTVYRTLEAFQSIGIVQRVILENGNQLFELTGPDEHFHHLICRQCHHTERLDVCYYSKLEAEARDRGFREISHVMEVYGLCAHCREADLHRSN